MDANIYDLAGWLHINADLLLALLSPFLWMAMFGAGLLLSAIVWSAIWGVIKFFRLKGKNSGPPHGWMS